MFHLGKTIIVVVGLGGGRNSKKSVSNLDPKFHLTNALCN